MRKLHLKTVLFLLTFLLVVLSTARNSFLGDNPPETGPGGVYQNNTPCSDDKIYAEKFRLQRGEITFAEFQALLSKHEKYKAENCKEGKSIPPKKEEEGNKEEWQKEKEKQKEDNKKKTTEEELKNQPGKELSPRKDQESPEFGIAPVPKPPVRNQEGKESESKEQKDKEQKKEQGKPTISNSKPFQLKGFTANGMPELEGGTSSFDCSANNLFTEIKGNQLLIKVLETKKEGNTCQMLRNDKVVMEFKFDASVLEGTKPMFNLVPAIASASKRNKQYIPFDFKNQIYQEWKDGQSACISLPNLSDFSCPNHTSPTVVGCQNLKDYLKKNNISKSDLTAECQLMILFPSRSGDKVFALRKEGYEVVKGLPATLFHPKTARLKFPTHWSVKHGEVAIGDLLYKLAIFLAYDPSLTIEQYPNKNGLFFTLIGKGSNKEGKYLISFGYNKNGDYVEFQPVQLNKEVAARRIVTANMLGDIHRSKLLNIIKVWQDSSKQQKVIAALPNSSSLNPLETLGNPTNTNSVPPILKAVALKKEPLNFLLEEEEKLALYDVQGFEEKVWMKNNPDNEHLFDILETMGNELLYYLLIADPNLTILAADESKNKLVFFFKEKKNALWSWYNEAFPLIGDMEWRTSQRQLLKGKEKFRLVEKKVSSYLEKLPLVLSSEEKEYWLKRAGDRRITHPLDAVFSNGGMPVLLYSPNQATSKIYQLGTGAKNVLPIQLFGVEIQWTDWQAFKPYYRKWRKLFHQKFILFPQQKKEAWYSATRFGSSVTAGSSIVISVGLEGRMFENLNLSDIQYLIKKDHQENASFIYLSRGIPDKTILFKSWLASDWRKSTRWRANPLGYLERLLLKRKKNI